MALALYAPGLGYYANTSRKFGAMPSSGSDFVTAPETDARCSAGAGACRWPRPAEDRHARGLGVRRRLRRARGATAEALGDQVERYTIVDLSGSLRERQQEALAAVAARVQWAQRTARAMRGVVVGNEVLDAMPVKLLARVGGIWHERGVVAARAADFVFAWSTARPNCGRRSRSKGARLPHRDPSAGAGLRAHAGRPAGGGRRLLPRLRLPREPSTTTRSGTWAR
jgi:hypothetical protein